MGQRGMSGLCPHRPQCGGSGQAFSLHWTPSEHVCVRCQWAEPWQPGHGRNARQVGHLRTGKVLSSSHRRRGSGEGGRHIWGMSCRPGRVTGRPRSLSAQVGTTRCRQEESLGHWRRPQAGWGGGRGALRLVTRERQRTPPSRPDGEGDLRQVSAGVDWHSSPQSWLHTWKQAAPGGREQVSRPRGRTT